MTELQVMPFAPGVARGMLCRNHDVAHDSIVILTQKELAAFNFRPAGIVVVDGAPLSHPMIRLLGLAVPTVIISTEAACRLEEGSEVLLDGTQGRIAWPADSDTEPVQAPEPPPAGEPVYSADGVAIALRASIAGVDASARALTLGASAIGLVRSEFLMPETGRIPDAAYFDEVLETICDRVRPLSVTVRLPDIAADKPVPWLPMQAGMTGPLGLQGIRLYDQEPVRGVVYAMLDAVTHLSDRYQFRLLLPYIVRPEEFRYWRGEIIQRTGKSLPIGIMAETPAAVLEIRNWFDIADFVAIGCNDLMQCLFAVDRDLPELRDYLDPYAPVLYRFLLQAADAAGNHLDRVQLCGLLAQMPGVLPVLLGMGFSAFSVEPEMIPYLANTVRETSLSEARLLAGQVSAARESHQVRELLGVPACDSGS